MAAAVVAHQDGRLLVCRRGTSCLERRLQVVRNLSEHAERLCCTVWSSRSWPRSLSLLAVPAARAAPRCTGVHGADVHGRVVVKFGRWSMVVGLSRASQFVS